MPTQEEEKVVREFYLKKELKKPLKPKNKTTPHDSDSTIQNELEIRILHRLNIVSEKTWVGDISFEFDGKTENELIEIYCVLDALKPGKYKKISQDILKMLTFEKLTNKTYKKTLIFIDEKIIDLLDYSKHKKWLAKTIESFDINLHYFELEEELLEKLRNANQAQRKAMTKGELK